MNSLETRNQAWYDLQNKLPARRKAVLEGIMLFPEGVTCHELSEALKWPVNEVSGRITELAKAGWIVNVGTRKNPRTGKKCVIWADNRPKTLF